jgi:FMN phosphatase YigB (HAD superfamily)
MINFTEYMQEARRREIKSSLHVFDIDDTLFHTHAKIHVKDRSGKTVQTLSNAEFNDHKLPAGHSYDFHEFRSAEKFHKTSVPIDRALKRIRAIHNNVSQHPNSRVIMNTARADFDDREKFLKTFKNHGVPVEHIHIHRAGNEKQGRLPAEKKNIVLRRYLEQHAYGKVHLYDDSITNLKYFLKLKQEYPNTEFHAWHAQPNGSIRRYNEESK